MRLVDPSAWIEFLAGSSPGQTIAAELPAPFEWLVPTMVQLELALSAADFAAWHRLATEAAVIHATARAWRADVLTCDQHLRDFRACCTCPNQVHEVLSPPT